MDNSSSIMVLQHTIENYCVSLCQRHIKNHSNMADIIDQNISESDYNSILQQAVAVIDKTRTVVSKSVCAAIGSAH